jgi:hypothetical protein
MDDLPEDRSVFIRKGPGFLDLEEMKFFDPLGGELQGISFFLFE